MRKFRMIRWRDSRDVPLTGRFSALGLALGAICFAASLTPSMIPRTGMVQGALGGLCFAAGYLIGAALIALRDWLFEMNPPTPERLRHNMAVAGLVAFAAMLVALWHVTEWQNGIHRVMDMEPVESARPFTILSVALGLAFSLILLGRLFRRLMRLIAAQLEPFVPRRVAVFAGLVAAALLFWSIGNDVVLGRILNFLDETYARVDHLVPGDQAPPAAPEKTGSAASRIAWDTLGAEGRDWILGAPDAAAIRAAGLAEAMEPLRIYVGLNSAETPEARAQLALQEALRIGAFERKVLVIATPTGTGWMDPAGMQPLEYLTGGDVATVAIQYSYLPSWLSLLVQPEYGAETAAALFRTFHAHWRNLPEESRPALYLFGLSLGARNAQLSLSLPELISAPPQGALFVGPPFAASSWQQRLGEGPSLTRPWEPAKVHSSLFEVRTQGGVAGGTITDWGPMRVVILEYPSDPIVFFSPSVLWHAPEWMVPPRAPDVSPQFRWFPVVTSLQLIFDMMTATTAPSGHGHVYASRDYLAAWQEVLGLELHEEVLARIRAAVASADP